MAQFLLIGIGAGLAAALLFAAPIGGTALAFPLFCLTGVPIAIAGFGWTPLAAIVASLSGAAALGAILSPLAGVAFLILFGLPVAWCVRLIGLSRHDGERLEWYPLGRVLLHATGAIAIALVVVGGLLRYDPESLAIGMTDALESWFASRPDVDPRPTRQEIEPFVRFNLAFLPSALAGISLFLIVMDLWLGAQVARMSGRMARPAEPLWTAALPVEGTAAFAVALALCFLPFPLGAVAAVVAGAAGAALALVGLAVLHALTLGAATRRTTLVANYVVLFFFGFPILLFTALGIAETLFGIRARRLGGVPPTT